MAILINQSVPYDSSTVGNGTEVTYQWDNIDRDGRKRITSAFGSTAEYGVHYDAYSVHNSTSWNYPTSDATNNFFNILTNTKTRLIADFRKKT